MSLKLDNWLAAPLLITCMTLLRTHKPFRPRAWPHVCCYLSRHYHFGQLLFHQFLNEQQRMLPSSSPIQEGVTKCKYYATHLSRIADAAMATPGCDVKYTMVGHITVTASSIHIHTLLFETDEKQICEARDQLEGIFNHLLGLEILGCTGSCFSRLKTFHEWCLKSIDTSCRMDR
ncbi:hypothetical protein J3458_000809 [Metarhizium acridum]|uniref:uncharacterized protein n=1 Tax=Metarhizium acridum TaxID=92637 RepID=UPI001C6B1717|nr:hypothetical protein J3458_000809 [Metarhizium acridum]